MDLSTMVDQGCTERQPTAKPSLGAASAGFKGKPARQFLELLGKEPAQAWLRAIKPGRNGAAEHQGLATTTDRAWVNRKTADGFNLYAVIGEASSATGKGGGVTDADITACPALFVEWDDGASIEEQMQRWQRYGLPEPSVMVSTGGKSVHCYWVLQDPISGDEWRRITARLIAHCNSDKQCSNPARVMRLPGSVYFDKKTGEPTGQCCLIHTTGTRYSAADVEACIPAPEPAKAAAAATPRRDWTPRSIEEINAAAEFIPARVPGNGDYPCDRNALCGCSAALAEAGHPDPDGAALALLGHLWPTEAAARQVLESTTTRKAGSFWAIASEHGYGLKRSSANANKPQQQSKPKPKPTQRKESKPRKLSHTRAMQCFDRCVEIQAKRERNSLRRRARLLAAAKALGIAAYVNRQEIAQRVLEAKQRATGEVFRPLTAADRAAMVKPVVRWLLPGLLPAGDLTIIGGRPKVGKTRAAVAMVAAVLNGEAMLDLPAPASTAPVVLVTDDQGDGDTADMLDAAGLWLHPGLTWSSNFRLTEPDLDALLETIKANPGALVVIDSLRSVSRALQYGENDPEIGATLYDLKQAVIDAGGTLLLIHHCNKTADAVGLEALSGHSSIGGAANTVLTMHYLPGENGHPNKEAPERRLFREPRSGEGFDLVVSRGPAGSFRKVSTVSQWQQQIKEAKEANKVDQLSETQEEVLDVLASAGDGWMTRRQVCEAVGVEWRDRGRTPEAQRITRALGRLVSLELAESQRAGVEATYRASHEAQSEVMTVMTVMPLSGANGSQCHHASDDSDDSDATQSGTGRHRCHHSTDDSNAIEKPLHDREASMSSMSSPTTDPLRLANEARIRELRPDVDPSDWPDAEVADMRQSLEQAARRRAAAAGLAIPEAA